MPPVTVDENGLHSYGERAFDVLAERVADHDRLGRCHLETLEQRQEDRLVRLRLPVRSRGEDGVGRQPVVNDELLQVPRRVREQPDLQPMFPHRRQRRQRIVVQLEMNRMRPAPLHLHRCRIGVAPAAHPQDDPLGEEHPDLLVVIQLRMPLHLRERSRARLVVPGRLEVEPVSEPERPVSVRSEVRPRPCEGEVDVEDGRAQHATRIRLGMR